MVIRAQQNPGRIPRERLQAGRIPGGSVVLVGQRVGHHTDHLLPGGLAGGGEFLAVVGSQDDDEDVTQELAVEGEEAVSWRCPRLPPHRPTPSLGSSQQARSRFIPASCRAPGSWHSLLSAMHQDPWVCWILPQHLPLPAVQCPPSASTEFTPSFSIPTHPGCPWAQNPPAKVAVLILPSGLPTPSQPSSALPSKPCLNSFHYGCSKMFLLTRTHLSLHFSPFTSPAWLPPLTDPSPITPLCSPQI